MHRPPRTSRAIPRTALHGLVAEQRATFVAATNAEGGAASFVQKALERFLPQMSCIGAVILASVFDKPRIQAQSTVRMGSSCQAMAAFDAQIGATSSSPKSPSMREIRKRSAEAEQTASRREGRAAALKRKDCEADAR